MTERYSQKRDVRMDTGEFSKWRLVKVGAVSAKRFIPILWKISRSSSVALTFADVRGENSCR
jgi:hypothetical protein